MIRNLVVGHPAILSAFVLSGSLLTGCGSHASSVGALKGAVTEVDQSIIKRQSIGNCWIHATASWVESMQKTATGNEVDISESYWTYWHWFEQIVNGSAGSSVSTGGDWSVSSGLIERYGLMAAQDFITEDATLEMSSEQKLALATINDSLSSGTLSADSARSNRVLVRQELNKAFGLSPAVVAQLDTAFGTDGSRDIQSGNARVAGTSIVKASDFAASFTQGPGTPAVKATLVDAINAWHQEDYDQTRSIQKRFQRALNDHQPVIMAWYVDFNALNDKGQFLKPPATPGRQGGHMVVMQDYQVSNVPGFGTLPVGVDETRPAALAAALDDSATLDLIRIKNSWGLGRPDRQFVVPGFHDLYMDYLNGPVQQCQLDANENPDVNNCWPTRPFENVVLPPGY